MTQRTALVQTQAVWLVLFAGCLSLLPIAPPLQMLAIALCMYLFTKTHLLLLDRAEGKVRSVAEISLWFGAWPGLNTRFFEKQKTSAIPVEEWLAAIAKIWIGIFFFLVVAPILVPIQPYVACWSAMIGFAMTLHFGLIHLLALFFRKQGRSVNAIMSRPLLATTISEFWGKRWNLAFRDYAHRTLFSPVSKTFGPKAALITGFAFSGLIHEFAISLPAHGGYGLPTLYFALQAAALLLEKRLKHLGLSLSGNLAGRLWCTCWLVIPAPFLLFHGPFVSEVVQPIVEFVAYYLYGIPYA
ncbi:MAG: MBOAT family protein [Planctomycetota bacterium]